MAVPTVKDLFEKWEGCKKESRVWEHLRDSLDQTMRLSKADNKELIRMPDGRGVENEVLMHVITELDGMIAELANQAERIEAQKVK